VGGFPSDKRALKMDIEEKKVGLIEVGRSFYGRRQL